MTILKVCDWPRQAAVVTGILLALCGQALSAPQTVPMSAAEGADWFRSTCLNNFTRLDQLVASMKRPGSGYSEEGAGFYFHSSGKFALAIPPAEIGAVSCAIMFDSKDPHEFVEAQVDGIAHSIDGGAFSNGKGQFLVNVLGTDYLLMSNQGDGTTMIMMFAK